MHFPARMGLRRTGVAVGYLGHLHGKESGEHGKCSTNGKCGQDAGGWVWELRGGVLVAEGDGY